MSAVDVGHAVDPLWLLLLFAFEGRFFPIQSQPSEQVAAGHGGAKRVFDGVPGRIFAVVVVVVLFAVIAAVKSIAEVLGAFIARRGRLRCRVDTRGGIRLEEVGINDKVVVLLDRRVKLKVFLKEVEQLRRRTIEGEIGGLHGSFDGEIRPAGQI